MFTAQSNLHNVGQFWNFAHLIGLRSVAVITDPKDVLECLVAQIPTGNYVRYSVLKNLEVIQELKDSNFYNSSTNPDAVGDGFLKYHFGIEDKEIEIHRVVCGIGGAGVVFTIGGNPTIYFLEVINQPQRPRSL